MCKKKRKRVEFTFDEGSYSTLEEMIEDGEEFYEIVVRHPETGEEKTIIIPILQSLLEKD